MLNINRKNQMKAEAGQAYRESLRKNLEHRLEVARGRGDDKLVKQLEQEASYLHLK